MIIEEVKDKKFVLVYEKTGTKNYCYGSNPIITSLGTTTQTNIRNTSMFLTDLRLQTSGCDFGKYIQRLWLYENHSDLPFESIVAMIKTIPPEPFLELEDVLVHEAGKWSLTVFCGFNRKLYENKV